MIKLGKAARDLAMTIGARPKRSWIEATVTRADGTVEHLGIICETHFTLRGKLWALVRHIFRKG